mgnify:CR=1 FL=1
MLMKISAHSLVPLYKTIGALVVSASDMHYGNPQHLLYPGRSTHMGDGWETRRRREPGADCTAPPDISARSRKLRPLSGISTMVLFPITSPTMAGARVAVPSGRRRRWVWT